MPDETRLALQHRETSTPAPRASAIESHRSTHLAITSDSQTSELERRVSEVYGKNYRRFRALACSMSTPDDAPDLVHDAFTAYWLRLTSEESDKAESAMVDPEALLVVMIRDAARSAARRQLRRLRQVVVMITGPVRAVKRWMEPAKQAEDKEIRSLVEKELRAMRPREREVFVLVHHHELPLTEVGRLLGIAASSARKELSRAAKQLRTRLTAAGYVRARKSPKATKSGGAT